MSTTTISIRVFTHQDVPNTGAVEEQAIDLAAAHGFGIECVAVDADSSEAMAAGVMALPAIVAYRGTTEIARRECVFAGRRMQRWFERKVSAPLPAYTLTRALV